MESLRVALHEETKLAAVLLEEQQVAMKAAVNALNEASLSEPHLGVTRLDYLEERCHTFAWFVPTRTQAPRILPYGLQFYSSIIENVYTRSTSSIDVE